jgi:hypothetical protein
MNLHVLRNMCPYKILTHEHYFEKKNHLGLSFTEQFAICNVQEIVET